MSDDDAQAPTVVAKKTAAASPADLPEHDRYRIVVLLGGGGGGQVYKAYDEQLGRNVALKFLNAVGPEHAAQLVKEARTQAKVQHASVCKVYEVVEGARPFIAMQLIEGPTLAAARLSVPEKVRVMRQVAEAVQAAHELGIVHRDLKPANIMLEEATDGWRPYVMDFGLAREVDKTLTNGVVGTPHFMAPEQARGEVDAIGPRTDVWALGATLYMVLAGRPPFDGESMMEILRRVDTEDPARLPSLPPELEAIILRCLEKDPARRYPSAAALAADLAAFERGDPVSARPPSLTRRMFQRAARHRGFLSIVVAALVLAGALVMALRRPAPKWRAVIRELEPSYEEATNKANVSPDGKWLAYSGNRDGESQLYVQSVDGGSPRLLSRAGRGSAPSWSSDGTSLFFFQEPGLGIARIPADESAPPTPLFFGRYPVECAGRLFYVEKGDKGRARIRVRNSDGSDQVLYTGSALANLECAPSGNRIAFTESEKPLQWLDTKDGVAHSLPAINNGTSITPAFRPDGRSLALTVRVGALATLWEQPLDGRPARQLTTGGHEFQPAFSPDGRRLFFNVEDRTKGITARSLDGITVRSLGSASADGWRLMVLTGDGRELIGFRRQMGTDNGLEMVAVSVADGSERVLGPGILPVVSPDDQQIYFRDSEHKDTVATMPRAGGLVKTVARLPGEVLLLRAAPDALHVTLDGETQRAWRQPYDGSAGAYEGSPEVNLVEPAADGWSVAVHNGSDFNVIVPPGSWPKILPEETRFEIAQLTADRRSFVASDEDENIWLVNIASKAERRLMRVPNLYDLALSPDGKTLYTIATKVHTRRAELTNYAELPPL